MFTSDHGEMLADHGLVHKGARFYEGAVRVPLIISWPARFRAGARCEDLVELTDIVPTLLETVGLKASAEVQGRSLLPVFARRTIARRVISFGPSIAKHWNCRTPRVRI